MMITNIEQETPITIEGSEIEDIRAIPYRGQPCGQK